VAAGTALAVLLAGRLRAMPFGISWRDRDIEKHDGRDT